MVRERGGSVATNDNAATPRITRRRNLGEATSAALPQTVEELANAILGLIRRYRETHGAGAGTDVALALAAADRENFRAGRR